MSKTFQAPAILTRISALADGGLSLGFHTNELSLEDKATALSYQAKFGYVLFRENEFTEADVPQDDAPSDEVKSPSQRLRAALFVLWKSRGEKGSFQQFYETQMDKAISRVTGLLD